MKHSNEQKKEIYNLLVGLNDGQPLPAFKIAKITGVSRAYISSVIKTFEKDDKIIKCINPGGRIKLYEATEITFEDVYETPKNSQLTNHEGRYFVSLQKGTYKVDIEREYTDFFEKQRKIPHGFSAGRRFEGKIFDNLGKWKFEKQGKKTLLITVPPMVLDMKLAGATRLSMFKFVYEALKWFCKYAHIRVKWDTLQVSEKPHVNYPAKSPKAKAVTEKFSLKINGNMLDKSSGHADWETTVFDYDMIDACAALDSWNSVAYVKKLSREVEVNLKKIQYHHQEIIEERETIAGMLGTFQNMAKDSIGQMEEAMKPMQELKEMMTNNQKKDKFMDVV